MTREFSSVQNSHLAGDELISYTLIDIGVNGASDLYYTDGPYDVTYNSQSYSAQGNFLGISETQETADLQITSINIVLSALDLTTVQTLAKSNQINQNVTVRRVFFNPETETLIGDSAGDQAITLFKGKIAGYRIQDTDDTATLTIEVTSQFANFDRKNGRRTNLVSFQREFATDFGMEYSHDSLLDIKWGKK